jgi:hypothetical protein
VGSPPQIPKGGISPSSLQNSIEMNTIFIHWQSTKILLSKAKEWQKTWNVVN